MSAEKSNKTEHLRMRAENLLVQASKNVLPADIEDINKLHHELAVHQAELELQNEELRNTQLSLQKVRDRYVDLYEHAPVGYVLLDAAGIIRHTNAAWRSMLGRLDDDFSGTPFAETLMEGDDRVFLSRFRSFFHNPAEKQMELRIRRKSSESFYAHITTKPSNEQTENDINELMIIVSDISERKQMENAIKAASNQLQATLNALPDLLFEVDSEGRIFSYHSPRNELLAAPPEDFLDKRFADVLPQEAADVCQRAIDEAAQSGFSYGETYRLTLPQGEHWFELSVAPLHVDDQSGQRFIMISRDITERKRTEIALHDAEQNAQYQLAFHRIAAETAAALTTSTSDAEFDTAINQCLQRLGLLFGADRSYVFQFSDDLAYTTNTHEWCADGIAPEMDNLQNLPMDDKSWLTTRLLRDGVLYSRVADLPPEAAAVKAEFHRQEIQSFLHATTRGAHGKLAGFIGFDSVLKVRSWRDDELDMIQTIAGVVGSLSVSKRSEKKLRASHKELQAKNTLLDTLSKTDQLTGIANRRRTQQIIEQEIDRFNRYKKPFCIFLFDIDHFKDVNDNHGHEVGDQVLVELVGLVQAVIRRTDTLGRWGGEEFILVCPETSLPTAQTIAEKICTTVREYEFTRDLGITLSIGVLEMQSGATLKEILVEVDRKMYLAKQNGRDRAVS